MTAATLPVTFAIDGRAPLDRQAVQALDGFCEQAHRRAEEGVDAPAVLRVSGAPGEDWLSLTSTPVVSKWERAVRRLEKLDQLTAVIASGDVGGIALDVLLAADLRIAEPSVRLVVPAGGGATWPGMALYRLATQAGIAATRAAVVLGRPMSAQRALDLGLLQEISDRPEPALAQMLGEVALLGKEMSIRRKLVLETAGGLGFDEALGGHLAACDRALLQQADGRAG